MAWNNSAYLKLCLRYGHGEQGTADCQDLFGKLDRKYGNVP